MSTVIQEPQAAITWAVASTSDASIVGSINGVNMSFILPNTPITNSLVLTHNGLFLSVIDQYSLAGATITLTFAPLAGDRLDAVFQY